MSREYIVAKVEAPEDCRRLLAMQGSEKLSVVRAMVEGDRAVLEIEIVPRPDHEGTETAGGRP